MNATALWLSLLIAQPQLQAQSTPANAAFAVASIKPSQSDQNAYVRWFPGGRMRAEHVALFFLIRFAWDLSEDQITGGPEWVSDEFFDIEATPGTLLAPEPNNGNGQVRTMLRALFAERFHLVCHFESRELPVYVLTIARSGLRLKRSAPGGVQHVDVTADGGQRKFTFASAPLSSIARNLSRQLKQTVVDHTGLQGQFDGTMEWSPDIADADSTGLSIFTAVQQQLGMRLQLRKTSVEVLVIDSARKPDEN